MKALYEGSELALKLKIDSLMKEAEIRWFQSPEHINTIFVEDGFYPNYTAQKIKILFIGRESYGEYPYYVKEGIVNLCDIYFDEYRANNLFRDILGRGKMFYSFLFSNRRALLYHANLLAMAYAILNDRWNFENFDIREIASSFGAKEGISFAVVNLSKSSNMTPSKTCTSNKKGIKEYTSFDRKYNILKREIEILEPDVIISANINDLCRPLKDNLFSLLGATTHMDSDKKNRKKYPGNLIRETLYIQTKEIPIYDIYHFSSRDKYINVSHDVLEKTFHYHLL